MNRALRVIAALGHITRLFALTFLLPIPFAVIFDPKDAYLLGLRLPWNAVVFLTCAALTWAISFGLQQIARSVRDEDLHDKEAYLTVGIGWIVLTVLAGIPFWANGTVVNPIDAFFEAMSGLTTTGATVIPGSLEDVDPSIMVWRSFLQYLGGMGIIVLSVALLARLTQGGIQLLQAEAPGPNVTRLRPKLAQTAKSLWGVYALLSAVALVVMILAMRFHAGLPWPQAFLDGVVHTFTTMSTGGFSNHDESIAYFDSWLVEAIIVVFILISAGNFTLHYYAIRGDWRKLSHDREFQFFLGIFVLSAVAVTGLRLHAGEAFAAAARGAWFTVAAIGTGTGYATVDYDQWPAAARLLLIVLMFTGGTAGSTTGGLKVVRIMILLKLVRREIRKLLHPRAVIPIRLASKPLKEETVMTVIAFFFSVITIWLAATLVVVATDPALDLFDAAVGAASMVSNVGPAMGVIGPTENYATLLPSTKMIFATLMWIGRLEVFTALLLFSPGAWKN